MGHIVKKIMGDFHKDPDYRELTIEYNSDGMVHIHLGALRLDLVKSAYNQLYDGVMVARTAIGKMHSWPEVLKTFDNGHGTKYHLIEMGKDKCFFVPSVPGLRWGAISDGKKEIVRSYSNKDNKIIEIVKSAMRANGRTGALSRFYEFWMPLVILEVCDFYDKESYLKHQAKYHEKISDFEFAESLYNDVMSEYQKFYNETGFYFSDISANNILISPNFDDYRIIDIESIDVLRTDIEVPPYRLLCGHFPANRSNSIPPGPAHRSADFLRVEMSKNHDWPKNLPKEIYNSVSKIKTRKIEIKR